MHHVLKTNSLVDVCVHCAIGAWQLWNAREGWKYEGCISCNSFWQLGRRDRLQGCEMVRMWGGEMVSAIASISSLPSQRCTLELHLSFGLGGKQFILGGKSLHGFTASKMFFRSSKFKTTTEIYEPEWHLSFGVVWMGAEHSPASLSQKAFLGFSRRELSSKKLFVSEGNSFCLFHSLLSGGHDAFVSEEEGICLVQ